MLRPRGGYADPALVGDLYPAEEFCLTLGPEDEGGEIFVRWESVGGQSVPQLQAFGDGWNLLPYFADVLAGIHGLHEDGEFDGDQFQEMLVVAGVRDATKRVAPKEVQGQLQAKRQAYAAKPRRP